MREQKHFSPDNRSSQRDETILNGLTAPRCSDSMIPERTRYGSFNLDNQAFYSAFLPSTQKYAAALGISGSKLLNLLLDPDRTPSPGLNAQLAHRIFREEVAPAAVAGLMGLCGKILCRGRGGDDLITEIPEPDNDFIVEPRIAGLQIKLVPSHGSLLQMNAVGHNSRLKAAAALQPGGDTRMLLIPVNASRSQLKRLFTELSDLGAEVARISVIHPQILHLAGSPLFVNKSQLRGPPENLYKLNVFMQACARVKGEEPPLISSRPAPQRAAIKSAARIIDRSIGFQEHLLRAAVGQQREELP